MDKPRIVIDTNAVVAALRSKRGASQRLFDLIDRGKFEVHLSIPLCFEYEEVCARLVDEGFHTERDIAVFLKYGCLSSPPNLFSLASFLNDPDDDMVLELAVASRCSHIVTFNEADFRHVEQQFGIRIVTPKAFLREIGELT